MELIAPPLLKWYGENRRTLPFRQDPQPYNVWVSEIMLQQTQVATALPYYERFIRQLPGVAALAACDEQKLHKLWEGLGYYSRVRNMQKAARCVMQQHGGCLPADYDALLALPGIGPYTAGAIASIAFGLPHLAVDGNVLRVASRLLCSEADIGLPQTKKDLAAWLQGQMPKNGHPGDFNQALMELGALVCTPQNPACARCPLAGQCRALECGMAAALPRKAAAKPKKNQHMCVLVVRRGTGRQSEVLLVQRPHKGLLAGLWQPVLLEGQYTRQQAQQALAALLPGAAVAKALGGAKHLFTHRVWQMQGWLCVAPPGPPPPGMVYATPGQVGAQYALPGAFKAFMPAIRGDKECLAPEDDTKSQL